MNEITYQRNNIIFRIASADAIGKFKLLQAQTFLQISRKELDFDEGAREVVLLEYDRFSHCLLKIEHLCLSIKGGSITKAHRLAFITFLKDELAVIENVMLKHPALFSEAIQDYTKMIHSYAIKVAYEQFYETENVFSTAVETYTNIAQFISEYLQHLLVSLHEFSNNTIKKGQKPFICIEDFCATSINTRFNMFKSHADFFKDHGVGTEYVVKNYSKNRFFEDIQAFMSDTNFNFIPENIEDRLAPDVRL